MGLRDRFRAALALDGDADPQARDEKYDPWGTTIDVDREEPERGEIEDWTEEYEENPLIRVPTQTFTSDILEPGVRVDLGIGEDDDMPTVSGYYDDAYNGHDLDDALEKWLTEAGIVDGEFDHDIRGVLEKALKDLVGRRGTAMVEVVYDDRKEQNRIMGLRPFKVETTTAYTREGKAILLRPDDGQEDADFENGFEATSTQSLAGDGGRSSLPQTPGGETACYIQFDDAYGSWDSKEVRFSQTDVVKHANDADTAEIFGMPYTASVYDRAHSVRQQYKDLDQALKAVSYSHFVAKVDTDDQDEAETLLSGFDPSNPEKVNVVNYAVDVEHHAGEMPDINATLKQEIEYVLSAFPVPIYRIGFEGEINRDVTGEQSDDYTRELSDWRSDIAEKFQGVIQRKAEEFVDSAPSVELVIAERDSENPLEDESFDADEFNTTMQGVKAATGPGQSPTDILPAETILETFLGLDPEEVLGDDGETADLSALDEADPRVRETFVDIYGADLAALTESDPVTTPDGRGVIVDVHDGEFEFQGDTYQPDDGTLHVVATEAGADVYERSELEEEDWTEEVDTGSPEDLQEAALAADYAALSAPASDPAAVEALLDTGFDSWPDSWKDADVPARLIALDAWTSMEASFSGCMSEIGDAEVCAAFKDEVLQWTGWR